MQQQKVFFGGLTLLGLSVRTNNANEMDPKRAKISALVERYHQEQTAQAMHHRSRPGVTYCAFTDYESDVTGDYTYFIGESVENLEGQDLERFRHILVPQGMYQRFTPQPGPMPDVVIQAWHHIWAMDEQRLGGKRAYRVDVEVYDQRATNPNHTALDLYIGIGTMQA